MNTRIFLTENRERIRQLLTEGYTYGEVAEAIGCDAATINKYNRYHFQIDIQSSFRARLGREGLPPRLQVSDAFGYWFSGFFDGEGHLGIMSRTAGRIVNGKERGYGERRLLVQIALRDDDTHVLRRVHEALGVGSVYARSDFKSREGTNANPSSLWKVERLQDLAEVIVPLLEAYPLHSKKARQFAIWSEVVKEQYVLSLGGRMQRLNAGEEWQARFDSALTEIKAIQNYAGCS